MKLFVGCYELLGFYLHKSESFSNNNGLHRSSYDDHAAREMFQMIGEIVSTEIGRGMSSFREERAFHALHRMP